MLVDTSECFLQIWNMGLEFVISYIIDTYIDPHTPSFGCIYTFLESREVSSLDVAPYFVVSTVTPPLQSACFLFLSGNFSEL